MTWALHDVAQRNCFLISAVAAAATCIAYGTMLMAQLAEEQEAEHLEESRKRQERTQWSESEVEALVNYLCDHHSERGDSGNFKEPTYVADGRCDCWFSYRGSHKKRQDG